MTDAASQPLQDDLCPPFPIESLDEPSMAAWLTTALRLKLVEHLGCDPLTAGVLDTELGGRCSVADVVEGRVEVDFHLLVELQEVFDVRLWPTAEEVRNASRAP